MTRFRPQWLRSFEFRLVTVDTTLAFWSFAGATLGTEAFGRTLIKPANLFWLYSCLLFLAWMAILALSGSRSPSILGAGAKEYGRVTSASLIWLGVASAIGIALNADISLSFLVLMTVFGWFATTLGRWVMRRWLVHSRLNKGMYCSQAVVIGNHLEVEEIAKTLENSRAVGFELRGKILLSGETPSPEALIRQARQMGADTYVIAGGVSTSAELVSQIGWHVEAGQERLVLVESLINVAGPRIEMSYIPNMSLLEVAAPTYAGATRFAKRLFDLCLATLAIVLFSPLMLAIAIGIRISSPGKVIFKQIRVGVSGELFTMYKFRTMVTDAEEIRIGLLDDPSRNTNEVLFKMKEDPRVTKIGKLLRRFSLDELPQLFNVISGKMSVVGPRPPLPEEVMKYEDQVKRRFLVKPGITGLWQVSGRADLSWRESVRLDLYYVENWSVLQDLQILWRTVLVVLRGNGAY